MMRLTRGPARGVLAVGSVSQVLTSPESLPRAHNGTRLACSDNPEARTAAYDQATRDMHDGALEPTRLSRRVRRALKAAGVPPAAEGAAGQQGAQRALAPQSFLGERAGPGRALCASGVCAMCRVALCCMRVMKL